MFVLKKTFKNQISQFEIQPLKTKAKWAKITLGRIFPFIRIHYVKPLHIYM